MPPLMKIFVHAQELKPFFRLLCVVGVFAEEFWQYFVIFEVKMRILSEICARINSKSAF